MAAASQESASHLGNGKGTATGVAQPALSGGAGVPRAICASLPNVHSAGTSFPLETFNILVSTGENERKGGVGDEQAGSYSPFSSLKPGEWFLLPSLLSARVPLSRCLLLGQSTEQNPPVQWVWELHLERTPHIVSRNCCCGFCAAPFPASLLSVPFLSAPFKLGLCFWV